MLMVISFPDTVSSVTHFSDAPARLNSASTAKSRAVSTGKQSGVSKVQKSPESSDQDFEAVLAWMIGGIVPVDRASAELNTAMTLKVVSGDVPAGPNSTSLSTTTATVTGSTNSDSASLHGSAASMPSQTAVARTDLQSNNGSALSSTDPNSPGTTGSSTLVTTEIQTTVIDSAVVIQSDLAAASEALSQDAIEALERIGRSPAAAMLQTNSSIDQGSATSVFTLSVTQSSELHAPETGLPSIFATSGEALNSSIATGFQSSGILAGSESSASLFESVAGPAPSDAEVPVSDTPGSQSSAESRSVSAMLSDAVRSDVVQPSLTHAFPGLATSVPGEMQLPLSNQVSQAIMEHLERNGVRQNDSLTVRLDPPDLGEMTIELSKTQEGLAVRVSAREAVTMDMLFARGQEIESQLRGQQMRLKSLEFLLDMSGNGFSQGQRQSETSQRAESLLSSVRRSSNVSSQADSGSARRTATESSHSLSFRA